MLPVDRLKISYLPQMFYFLHLLPWLVVVSALCSKFFVLSFKVSESTSTFEVSLEKLVINPQSLSITSFVYNHNGKASDWVDRNLGSKSVFYNSSDLPIARDLGLFELITKDIRENARNVMRDSLEFPGDAFFPACSVEMLGFTPVQSGNCPFCHSYAGKRPTTGVGELSFHSTSATARTQPENSPNFDKRRSDFSEGGNPKSGRIETKPWKCYYRAQYENWRRPHAIGQGKYSHWATLIYCPAPDNQRSCIEFERSFSGVKAIRRDQPFAERATEDSPKPFPVEARISLQLNPSSTKPSTAPSSSPIVDSPRSSRSALAGHLSERSRREDIRTTASFASEEHVRATDARPSSPISTTPTQSMMTSLSTPAYSANIRLIKNKHLKTKSENQNMAICVPIPYTDVTSDQVTREIVAIMIRDFARYYARIGIKVLMYDINGLHREELFGGGLSVAGASRTRRRKRRGGGGEDGEVIKRRRKQHERKKQVQALLVGRKEAVEGGRGGGGGESVFRNKERKKRWSRRRPLKGFETKEVRMLSDVESLTKLDFDTVMNGLPESVGSMEEHQAGNRTERLDPQKMEDAPTHLAAVALRDAAQNSPPLLQNKGSSGDSSADGSGVRGGYRRESGVGRREISEAAHSEYNLVYHDYTILGMLAARKGVTNSSTSSSSSRQGRTTDKKAGEITIGVPVNRNLAGYFHITDTDKVLTLTHCRFEAKEMFGIDHVFVADFDEFFYCPKSRGNATKMAEIVQQRSRKFAGDGLDQAMYLQYWMANKTENVLKCVRDQVKAGESMYRCFSPFEYSLSTHAIKPLHLGNACPLTTFHEACDYNRKYNCLCNSLISYECGFIHLSLPTRKYAKKWHKVAKRYEEFMNKSSEIEGMLEQVGVLTPPRGVIEKRYREDCVINV